jgi:uncharacterized repeat protein (TIGR03803 family)
MPQPIQLKNRNLRIDSRLMTAALAIVFLTITVAIPVSHAQTLTVLHSFTGGRDGANPAAGLTMDAGGNLYGTTKNGGAGYGTVFKLSHSNSGWTLSPLYSFASGPDGANPVARVVFGPDHSLYGTTQYGGTTGDCNGGCGTVFNLKPAPSACKTALCPWIETILLRFTFQAFPMSEVVFDSSGNLYGTTFSGGKLAPGGGNGCYPSCGTVYELTPSNGNWTESIPYAFRGAEDGDGSGPVGGLIFDSAGNLYGTTADGGNCAYGTLFQLSTSGSGWSEHILHHFCAPAAGPAASMIADPSGNFYGTTLGNSPGQGTTEGSVFALISSNGSWMWEAIYAFRQRAGGPAGQLLLDGAGNLYGTTTAGGSNPLGVCSVEGCGTIFELTPSNGGWSYTELYDFTGGSDGATPYSNLVMDKNGNLFGTTSAGGQSGDGVVFEFTP